MPPRASAHDPYRVFKFRVRLDDTVVAGVTKVSALGRTVAANPIKEAGDLLAPRQSPGEVSYDEVTVEWGLSLDRSDTFESWANAVTRLHADPASVKNFKRTVFIDVYGADGNPTDRASKPVRSYKLHRCWVSKYTAMSALDADSAAVGIQSMSLQHEGWERVT